MRPNGLPQADAGHLRPVFFVSMDLPSGMIHMTTMPRDEVIGGVTYTAVSHLGNVSLSGQSDGLEVGTATLDLIGMPFELYNTMESELVNRRDVFISISLIDESYKLAFQPVAVFAGKVSRVRLTPLPTLSVTVEAGNRLTNVRSINATRYTSADQKALYPNDKGLDFVAKLASTELLWGR